MWWSSFALFFFYFLFHLLSFIFCNVIKRKWISENIFVGVFLAACSCLDNDSKNDTKVFGVFSSKARASTVSDGLEKLILVMMMIIKEKKISCLWWCSEQSSHTHIKQPKTNQRALKTQRVQFSMTMKWLRSLLENRSAASGCEHLMKQRPDVPGCCSTNPPSAPRLAAPIHVSTSASS